MVKFDKNKVNIFILDNDLYMLWEMLSNRTPLAEDVGDFHYGFSCS